MRVPPPAQRRCCWAQVCALGLSTALPLLPLWWGLLSGAVVTAPPQPLPGLKNAAVALPAPEPSGRPPCPAPKCVFLGLRDSMGAAVRLMSVLQTPRRSEGPRELLSQLWVTQQAGALGPVSVDPHVMDF